MADVTQEMSKANDVQIIASQKKEKKRMQSTKLIFTSFKNLQLRKFTSFVSVWVTSAVINSHLLSPRLSAHES